jgi:two-component system, OmpR family, phosphate regulon sensor histidine kinase PhoR
MENQCPKILIIEDEKVLRSALKNSLEAEGFDVKIADSGTEGITLAGSIKFEAAIIDLIMPGIGGMQVLQEIKKISPHTVCIITTGYASYETAIQSIKLGAFSYLPKPIPTEELLENINKGLQQREQILALERWKSEREERLLEVAFEKTRLNTIINSITDGVLVINKNGEAVLHNPSALKYLNLNSLKIEEKIIDKIPSEISEQVKKILDENISDFHSYSTQLEVNTPQKFFMEATSSPVPHPDGSLAGVVIVMKDITELKRIESLKSQFVSMVSHELKAPVAAVYGYLKLINDESLDLSNEQKKNFIARSLLRLDQLLKMVSDLLDISRIELKAVKREIKQVYLPQIISSIIELFQLEIIENKLNVSVNFKKNLPLLNADSDEINRLFTNLISNAIKYNNPEGSIAISVFSTDNYLVTQISDTGIGINSENLQKLFEEFFRVKSEYTKTISGTGLGLTIVKKIVDNYSGKIEVESKPDAGTTFKVYLPFMRN